MFKDNIGLETFHYNNLVIDLHPEVYDPAEDTFLLIESIKVDQKNNVLELGTGCGLIGLECARRGAYVISTDVNSYAVALTRHNYKKNRNRLIGTMQVRLGNLFSVVKNWEIFDIILFNPPYLPTSEEEKVGGWFDIATNGGKDGLLMIKRFIQGVRKYISDNGHVYFVFSSLLNRSKLEEFIIKEEFNYEVVTSRIFDFEKIDIYSLTLRGNN